MAELKRTINELIRLYLLGERIGPQYGQSVVYQAGTTYKATGPSGDVVTRNTNASTVIQAAIDANLSVKLLGNTTYTCTSAIVFPSSNNQVFEGEGASTLLQCNGSSVSPLLAISGTTKRTECIFRNFAIQSTSAGSGTGFNSSYFTRSRFQNLKINDFNGGVLQSNSTNYNLYDELLINSTGAGGYCINLDTDCNDNVIMRSRTLANDNGNVTGYVMTGISNTLISCNCEGGTTDPLIGIDVAGTAHSTSCYGCYLEANDTNLRLGSGVEGFEYMGGNISAGDVADITDNGAVKPLIHTSLNSEPYFRMPEQSGASDPTATDIPNRQWCLWRTTTGGAIQIWYNDNGTLKKVALV